MKEKSPRNMPVLKTYYFWTFTLSFYIVNNMLMVCYKKNPTSLAILHFCTNNVYGFIITNGLRNSISL